MLLFKQSKPFCKPFKIILHKAHIYQVLLSTFSIFHAEMSQKVAKRRIHDYTLTQGSIHETLLETHTRPASSEWETIHVDHVNSRMLVSTSRRVNVDVRAPSELLVTSNSCRFPEAFILMVDIRSAKTVSVDCKASCSAGSDSGDADTSSSARDDWSSLISSWSMRISSINACGEDCGITLLHVFFWTEESCPWLSLTLRLVKVLHGQAI